MVALSFILAVAQRAWQSPVLMFTVTDSRIKESSGIAVSPGKKGVYYTHNDSGEKPRFFRFTKAGVDAVFDLPNAKAVDWEDMKCVRVGGRSMVYLADVGDNQAQRKMVTIYRLPEQKGGSNSINAYETYNLIYPDGAHDCETLIVTPGTGDITLVTKNDGPSTVYFLARPPRSGDYKLTKLGRVTVDTGLGKYGRLVTSGDADPAGKHVVLRSYSGAVEFTVKGSFNDWWKQPASAVIMPFAGQAEAICYTSDGTALVMTTEGSPFPVHSVVLKK